MLKLSGRLIDTPVLSLRTGAPVATVTGAIINPDNLKIEGFYCLDKFSKEELVLLAQDIRDVLPQGLVVNDHEVLVEPEDLIRLKKIMEYNFDPIGKQVVTTRRHRVGKVSDYAVETESMYIQKIYASQSFMKNLAGGSLSIDRNQITEVTPKKIVINELLKRAPASATAAVS